MCSIASADLNADAPLELVERELCELSAHLAAGMCRWLRLVGEFDERGGWAEWGVYSCAHWLSWRCGIALRAARDHVRVARALRQLPLTDAAFAAGEISYSKVRALTRVATPDNEESLLMVARHATGAQLEKIVSGYRRALEATTEGAQAAIERRCLYVHHEDDGMVRIEACVTAEDGALLLSALEHAERAAASEGSDRSECSAEHTEPPTEVWMPDPQREPRAARRADALIALARAELASDARGYVGADDVEVVVHVDVETLASDEIRDRSELGEGRPIAPETARRLGCDAGVRRIIERDGKPLTVGRRTRSVPPALRRALHDRDDGCRFPGCTHGRYLHAHHIKHWIRGGRTDLENLLELCSYHHRLVHEGGFQVERVGASGVKFRRPDGRLIAQRPPPPIAAGPGVEQQHRAMGIEIDDQTCMPKSAGQPCDYSLAVEGLLAPEVYSFVG